MSPASAGDVYEETLTVFDERATPFEPLTTPEIADALDCGRRTVYKRLDNLVGRGELETKKVGSGARVWWRPTDHERSHDELTHRYRAIVENFPNGALGLFDHDLRYTIVGGTAFEDAELSAEDIEGRRIGQTAPESSELLEDHCRAALDGESRSFEFESGGKIRQTWTHPVEDENGEVFAGLVMTQDVTDRGERERQLEEHRRQYRTLIENFPSGAVALVDRELRYVTFGGTPEGETELTREDLEGKLVHEVLPQQVADVVVPRYEAALDGESSVFEDSIDERVYQFHFVPVRDDEGEVFAVTAMSQDITERKRRKRELEESRYRYRALVDHFPNGIVTLFDGDFRYQIAGGELFEELGTSPEDMVGQTIYERNAPEDVELLEPAYEAAMDGNSYSFETEHAGRVVEIRTVPIRDEAGTVFAGMAMSQDVTDRQRRERDLERYERIVETVRDGVYALDPDDRFVLVNRAFCDLVGHDRETLLGAHPRLINSQAVNDAANDLQAEIQAGERDVGVVGAEFETATGESVPVEGRIAPFEYADGRVGRCGVVRDVTEQVAYERKLKSQRERLAALNDVHSVAQSVINLVVDESTIDELARVMCDRFAESDVYESAWMGRVSRNGRELTVTATSERDGRLADVTIPLHGGDSDEDGPIARAVRTGSIRISENLFDDRSAAEWPIERRCREHTGLVVPLQHEGRSHGVLTLFTDRPGTIDDFERELIQDLGEVVGHVLTALERERALVAEQVVEVEYRSKAHAEPFVRAAQDEVEITIDRALPLPDGGSLHYVTCRGITPEQYRDVASTYPGVVGVRILSEKGDQFRAELRSSSESIASLFTTFNGRITTFELEAGEFKIITELPLSANLREVTERLKESLADVELVGHRTVTRQPTSIHTFRNSVEEAFTDRQQTVLESAFAAGYFEWPRNTTAEDLAEIHDVHPSTLHKHLRRAEQKLVSTAFDATG